MSKHMAGWKQIAKYFDVSIRTIKRWHYSYPMPISKIRNTIMATERDLDKWIKKFRESHKKRD